VLLEADRNTDDDAAWLAELEAQPIQFLFPPQLDKAARAERERVHLPRLSALHDPLWAGPIAADAIDTKPDANVARRRAWPECSRRLALT